MNFIKELEAHLESFEGKAKAEIAQFIAYARTKYSEPAAAVVRFIFCKTDHQT